MAWRHADAPHAWRHADASRGLRHADASRGLQHANTPRSLRHAVASRGWWHVSDARCLLPAWPFCELQPGSAPHGPCPCWRGQSGRRDSGLCGALLGAACRAGQHDPLGALLQPRSPAGNAAVAPRAAAGLHLIHEAAHRQRMAHCCWRRGGTAPAGHQGGAAAGAGLRDRGAISRDRGASARASEALSTRGGCAAISPARPPTPMRRNRL